MAVLLVQKMVAWMDCCWAVRLDVTTAEMMAVMMVSSSAAQLALRTEDRTVVSLVSKWANC